MTLYQSLFSCLLANILEEEEKQLCAVEPHFPWLAVQLTRRKWEMGGKENQT